VGVLSHYLEASGIPTTGISLIRLHSEKIRPPRALWVPFELGRPLGVPDDAEFQSRVLRAALGLFNEPSGPLLVDYAEEAPEHGVNGADRMDGLACPMRFDSPSTGTETLTGAVLREIGELQPWYDLAFEKRRRTTFGASGLEINEAVRFLGGWLDVGQSGTPAVPGSKDLSPEALVKLAAEDLKVFYFEAVSAQPQPNPLSARQLADWFWGETSAARFFVALREHFLAEEQPSRKLIGQNLMVPREQWSRFGIKDRWWSGSRN